MRLGGMILSDFNNANSFSYAGNVEINQGNSAKICIQLVDYNNKICSSINGTYYMRYIPTAPATLTVSIPSIDQDGTIERIATQDANDPSIFCFDIYATDELASEDIMLSLSEGTSPNDTTKTGMMVRAIKVNRVGPTNGHSYC